MANTLVDVSGVDGKVTVLPLKLEVVTPRDAAIMLVSCVTPMEMLPPPTLGTTASRDEPAGKGLAADVSRSSK